MSNSPLTVCTILSPNDSGKRTHAIDRITIHCVVGQCSAEALGYLFADRARYASSNYGVDTHGRVGLYVPEDMVSWCSSSGANDNRAVTIETASDNYPPYAVNEQAYAGLLDLCEDICRRNGKRKLLWLGEKYATLAYEPAKDEMVMTVHRWFANKSCPGEYLYSRMGEIAEEVTRRLTEEDEMKRYNTIDELPEWARPTVIKLCARGVIQGRDGASDGDGYPTGLDLSDDMIRMMIYNDRAGLYDWQETNTTYTAVSNYRDSEED